MPQKNNLVIGQKQLLYIILSTVDTTSIGQQYKNTMTKGYLKGGQTPLTQIKKMDLLKYLNKRKFSLINQITKTYY